MSIRSVLKLITIFLVSLVPFVSHANQSLLHFSPQKNVRVCQIAQVSTGLPTFNEPGCRDTQLYKVDPQQRELWLLLEFDLSQHLLQLPQPYGLYIFGKASSVAYLNGVKLGSNGLPAADESEQIGKMDVVFHVPETILAQKNQLILHLSSQHSIIDLDYPIHFIGIGQYGEPQQHIQKFVELGLVLVGAFLVGALYFLALSFGPQSRMSFKILSVMCFIAASHLVTEMSRGLFNYDYPVQDIRLITVTILSFLFGIALLAYSSVKVAKTHAMHWIYSGIILTLSTILLIPGFDTKTTAAIFIPLLISLGQIGYLWWLSKERSLAIWFIVQLIVAVTIFVSFESFHEITYFVLVGILLCYLFTLQAREYKQQQQQLAIEQALVTKLEFKLSQNLQSVAPSKLEISMAGKTEFVLTSDIVYCKASGDYVELHMKDRSQKLYSGSLKRLESILPSTFIKVHRSYLVNLSEVAALEGKSGDSQSNLCLTNDELVPVSRRLVATVKASLKSFAQEV